MKLSGRLVIGCLPFDFDLGQLDELRGAVEDGDCVGLNEFGSQVDEHLDNLIEATEEDRLVVGHDTVGPLFCVNTVPIPHIMSRADT